MKKIIWIVLGWFSLLAAAQAASFDCTQFKRFVRCGNTTAQPDIPVDVIRSIARTYPDSHILSEDLDGDGIRDFVVLSSEKTVDGLSDRILILKGKQGGGYVDFAKSSNIEYGKASIEIKKRSLYVFVSNNTLKEYNRETYQFKYRHGGFFLIGKEEKEDVPEEGNSSNISTNYLTGEEIEVSLANGKKTVETRHVPEPQLIRLEDFSR